MTEEPQEEPLTEKEVERIYRSLGRCIAEMQRLQSLLAVRMGYRKGRKPTMHVHGDMAARNLQACEFTTNPRLLKPDP